MNPENALNAVVVLIAGIMFGGMTYIFGIASEVPPFIILLIMAIFTYETAWGIVSVARN